jgi:hypothetical protein
LEQREKGKEQNRSHVGSVRHWNPGQRISMRSRWEEVCRDEEERRDDPGLLSVEAAVRIGRIGQMVSPEVLMHGIAYRPDILIA